MQLPDSGTQDVIKARRARQNIGTIVKKEFIEGVHHRDDQIYCEVRRKKYADNQLRWFVNKVCKYALT